MEQFKVFSRQIYTTDGIIEGTLEIENGVFKKIAPGNVCDDDTEDFSQYRIIPGLFETHCHGSMGYSVHTKENPDLEAELKGLLKGLASYGVTNTFVLTRPEWMSQISELCDSPMDGASVLGIFSEGPYLNRVGENGIKKGYPDVDLDFVKKMVKDCNGKLKLVALSPEIEGIDEVIRYLISENIIVAVAHTDCNYEQTKKAFDMGIKVSTHTGNVMKGIHHRDIGALGACLMDDRIMCEIICDGLRICPQMLDLMFRVKPLEYFMMISDGGCTIGGPSGRYKNGPFGDFTVTPEGLSVTDTGRLAGSNKTLLQCVRELVEEHHIPLERVLKITSYNQCKTYGYLETKGEIKCGKDADFVIIDDAYSAVRTYTQGRKVYDRETDGDVYNRAYLAEYYLGREGDTWNR